MTIKYYGKNLEEGRTKPEAQIVYDEIREEKKAEKIAFELQDCFGYDVFVEDGMMVIPLIDKLEYEILIKCYKVCKQHNK